MDWECHFNTWLAIELRGLLEVRPARVQDLKSKKGRRAKPRQSDGFGNFLNARSGISPDMAVRLEKAFGTPARELLIRQLDYELAEILHRTNEIKVEPFRDIAQSATERQRKARTQSRSRRSDARFNLVRRRHPGRPTDEKTSLVREPIGGAMIRFQQETRPMPTRTERRQAIPTHRGWARDRADPHARDYAIAVARLDPPPGLSPDAAEAEVREVLTQSETPVRSARPKAEAA